MRPYRNLKVGSVLEHELAKLLARDFHVEGALVTLSGVDVSEDLLHATAYVSIIPYEKEIEVYKEFGKRRGELEHLLYKKMNIRPFPHLEFSVDSPDEKLRAKKRGGVKKW